ncbi:LPS export ABC transporter periplasmic protein LptC [Sunxiuqinia elliptica]|uniref:LPS export ABC transporter protein LptC n=1 Tax=Sunxiuqinia elliptica TaxID=655355 RepID=A0A1I2F4F4_9BACT|nr:LPS export ABC transporter periplasmic protein LptC [Sunxiuqinia elliptica]SFE99863.1 LPS export ABC transporter protein LptC [Sunxiuqinia elliptica]
MKQQKLVRSKLAHTQYSKVSIAILSMGIAMLFFSCANKIEKIKEFSAGEKLASIEAENYEMIQSDSSIIRFKLTTPKFIHFDQAEPPFIEFPEGVAIQRYNEKMEQIASITSNYARYFEKDQRWEAQNDVVAVNPQGDTLKTEELIWEEEKGKIYSEQFVKIIRKDGVLTGIGLESDQNLSNWQIKKPRGPLYFEVEE